MNRQLSSVAVELLAAALGGLIAAISGSLTTLWASRSKQREAARGARREAYLDVLRSGAGVVNWAANVPDGLGADSLPEPLSYDELIDADARVALYGSKKVRDAYSGFVTKASLYNGQLDLIRGTRDAEFALQQRSSLPTEALALSSSFRDLAAEMRADGFGSGEE